MDLPDGYHDHDYDPDYGSGDPDDHLLPPDPTEIEPSPPIDDQVTAAGDIGQDDSSSDDDYEDLWSPDDSRSQDDLQVWLDMTGGDPSSDHDSDPAADAWLTETLGSVPSPPADAASSEELIDRVMEHRRALRED